MENTRIDKTTEFNLLSGTLLHMLLRITLPFIFLCHIINSAHLLTSGSFSAWQISYFSLPQTIWVSDYWIPPSQLHVVLIILQWLYHVLFLLELWIAAVQLNHKRRPIPGKILTDKEQYTTEWQEWVVKTLQMEQKQHLQISGKAET